MAQDVWSLVERRAQGDPDRIALVADSGERLTFAQLHDEALAIAGGLHALGVGVGSRVTWQLPTKVESILLTLALARLGAVQNMVLPILRARELSHILRDWQPEMLIVPRVYRSFAHGALARELLADHPRTHLLEVEDQLPRVTSAQLPAPVVAESDEPRWVLYTSGSTSDPKGVCHSDRSAIAMGTNLVERLEMTPADRYAFVAPIAHVGGLMLLTSHLVAASTNLVADVFNDDTIAFLDAEGVTLAGMGTPFHEAYLRYRRQHGERVLTSVRGFAGGGSGRPADLHRRLVAEFGVGILSGYGSTETGPLTLASPKDPDEVRARTEGRAYPRAEVTIFDGQDNPVPAGVEGQVMARGDQMMVGYVDPALGGARADGWFPTGDLGSLDESGNLTITGRIKDIIIRKGENISAVEVEQLISEHPDVRQVAVVGIPDASTGERCVAVVSLVEGSTIGLPDLARFLKEAGLAVQKIPEQLEVIDELPTAGVGKIAKHLVRRALAAASA